MPGGDRMGPMGAGPRTGRAAGYCAGYGMPGFANAGFGWGHGYGPGRGYGRGWGMGFGRGGGRGWRHRYWAAGVPGWGHGWFGHGAPSWTAPPLPEDTPPEGDPQSELAELKGQSKNLQETLDRIHQRIDELEKHPRE
jgi:hypothetical protein